jgi:hypothetical protein
LIEEIRGGIRLGGLNEFTVEVVMRTPEDAAALAGIGPWLPGLIAAEKSFGPESAIVELAENFFVRANGAVVSVSFSIPERGLEDLLASRLRQNEGDHAGTAGRNDLRRSPE